MAKRSDVLVITGMISGTYVTKSLLTNFNLDEYHTIIWNLASFAGELRLAPGTDYVPAKNAQGAQSRLKELEAWVAEGHNLIMVLTEFSSVKVFGDSKYQKPLDLRTESLLTPIRLVPRAGERVEYVGPDFPVLKAFAEQFRYQFVLLGDGGIPLLRVARSAAGPEQIVGLARQVGKGRIFLMPPVASTGVNQYPELLVSLSENIPIRANSVLPEWVNEYHGPRELKASATISNRTREIADLQVDIDAARDVLAASAWTKELFAGSGDAFVEAVSRALDEMGLRIAPGPHPRGDLLIRNADKIAVAEVKGLDGITREANLRQAQRWVADVNSTLAASAEERTADPHLRSYGEQLTALDIKLDQEYPADCKGIMVIGTFRKVPPEERTEKDFPDDVLRIAERDDLCCITGLDLLVWVLSCQANESLKDEFRTKLFSTRGRLAAPVEWKSQLKKQ